MNIIRALIIDDHTLFRSGIKSLLLSQDDIEVIGEASDGFEGLKQAKKLMPDIVLLDLHMPGMGGLEVLQILKEDVPETEVLMLTVSEDAQDLLSALRSGARGYLLKNIEIDFLMDSIHRAVRGESVMSPYMASKLADSFRQPTDVISATAIEQDIPLTPRETEIISMLAKGESNKSIARELDLAESTVKIHVQAILRKLNLTSRVQAAVYAVERGLVPSQNL